MIRNQKYIETLNVLDEMLSKVSDSKNIDEINQKILENYKEV